jgi:spermidine/putrescine transport system ATP-binding protein
MEVTIVFEGSAHRGEPNPPSPIIELRELAKSYPGGVQALAGIDLDVGHSEFLSLLGPSGSGKTTTLRLIAGFDRPTRGTIVLEGKRIDHLPPNRRPVNTVFQDYALFPHLDVRGNVGFGLKALRLPRAELGRRVEAALELVSLREYAARAPSQLSGGQRQRVALARALVMRPRALLLDEPLGALDLKLRKQMQIVLMNLRDELGITFIYVTHDQEEALTMSDRVAVMRDGRIEQCSTPRGLYAEPATAFVAGFVGENNFIQGRVTASSGAIATVDTKAGVLAGVATNQGLRPGDEALVAVRPEHLKIGERPGLPRITGRIRRQIFAGTAGLLIVSTERGAEQVSVRVSPEVAGQFKRDEPIALSYEPSAARVFGTAPR